MEASDQPPSETTWRHSHSTTKFKNCDKKRLPVLEVFIKGTVEKFGL